MVQVRPLRYRLALVLNTLFFPFTFPDIFESFKAQGFTLGGSAMSRVPVALGAQLYVSGPFANKDDVLVDLDHDRKIMGAEGKDIDVLSKIFDEILGVVQEDFQVDLGEDVAYVELSAAFLVKTDKGARESIEKLFSKDREVEALKGVLGFAPVIRQFTLSERGKPPEGKEYVEFNVTHRLTARDTYYIQAVFRHPEVTKASDFARTINEKVSSLVEAIEAN